MKERWNKRAQRNAFYYVETSLWEGDVDAFFQLGEERARLLVDPALQSLSRAPSEATALDLGCGVGRFTRALGRRFHDVLGVDVSSEMIRRAEELHPRDEFSNLRFLASDGISLDVPSDTVDFVFSYEVFQHLPSQEVIRRNLREIARVMRPDAVALLHVHTSPSHWATMVATAKHAVPDGVWWRLKRLARRGDPYTGDATFRGTRPLAQKEIEAVWEACGLRVRGVRDDPTHPPGTRVLVEAGVA